MRDTPSHPQPSGFPALRLRRTIGRLLAPGLSRQAKTERQCPICGFAGLFWSFGSPPRPEILCPQCFSLERHRLLKLLLDRPGIDWLAGKRVLHFAPEPFVRAGHGRMARYVAADIAADGADCRCAFECLPWADAAFDVVIANQGLEPVKSESHALGEIGRVLAPGGFAILSLPGDSADRLRGSGFAVETFRMDERGQVRFALDRGQQLLIARRTAAQ